MNLQPLGICSTCACGGHCVLFCVLLVAMLSAPHQSEGFLNTEQVLELIYKGISLLRQLWIINLPTHGMGQRQRSLQIDSLQMCMP